jgi:serine protease AprX
MKCFKIIFVLLLLQSCASDKLTTGYKLTYHANLGLMMSKDWDSMILSGKGVKVGIIDEGFQDFKINGFTKNLHVKEYKDFVTNSDSNFFTTGSIHGTKVAQNFGGKNGIDTYGTAYNAEYYLAITDDTKSETKEDEKRAVEAIEWMIQKGVRVINISLGYKTFDNPNDNYTNKDLYNNSTFIANAVNRIIEKYPMVTIVTPTGNSLFVKDNILTTPADVKYVVAVASCNLKGTERVASSLIGLETAPYIKPDVAAYPVFAGTSFAAPSIAGLIAAMLECKPELSNKKIIEILHQSGTLNKLPNYGIGYGVPQSKTILELIK